MKVHSNIILYKRNISVKVQPIIINPITNQIINKWNDQLRIIDEILEIGNTKICFQEFYQKINDLVQYEIPDEISDYFNKLIKKHSDKFCRKMIELSNINNFDEFFEIFNQEWTLINSKFILLRKLMIKFEKKYFSKNLSSQTIFSLCK